MELIGVNRRIERIKTRIEKEYVFDETSGVVIDMKADLIWAIKVFAQIKTDLESLIEWAKTDNPVEGEEKWNALPEYMQDRIAPCP